MVIDASGWAEDGWVGITLPADASFTDVEIYDLVQAIIPNGAVPQYQRKFRARERRSGEIVYRWEHYE